MSARAAPAPEREFSTNEVAERLGVSLRQCQWWAENKFIPVGYDGRNRVWNERDFLRTGILSRLPRIGTQGKWKLILSRAEPYLDNEFLVMSEGLKVKGAENRQEAGRVAAEFGAKGEWCFVMDLGEIREAARE